MDLGVVTDTHDNAAAIEAAVDRFETAGVDAVIHCGDVIAPFSAAAFEGDWDLYVVRGNNDGEWALEPTVEDVGTYLGEMGELDLDGTAIAAYHGTSQPIVDALVECGTYDLVVHGHTHRRVHEDRDGTISLNPGGVPLAGLEADPAAAVVDLDTLEVDLYDLL